MAHGFAPIYVGGLGFGLKWDMGWMHDTLEYFSARPHSSANTTTIKLTFRMLYAFHRKFRSAAVA